MTIVPDDNRFFQAVELTTATYDQVARNYAERNQTRPPHWSERMDAFVDLLVDNEGAHPIPDLGRPGDDSTLEEYLNYMPVLDAGCGPGRDARALADYGLPILGVDISQGMLDEAGERTARRLARGSIRYALMDLRALDLPDASCRGVWCSASLLHLPRKTSPRAVGELARVAHAGAPVVVLLKRLGEGRSPETFLQYEYADIPGMRRFFAYYTPDEARALVEGAGLTVLDVTNVPDARNLADPGWVSLLACKP
jgi:SAM-dependent methyltransferase